MNENFSKLTQTESTATDSITLDCDHLFAHAGGDPELLTQLCTRFLSELPLHLENVRSVMAGNVHRTADHAVQQLRNSLMIFGYGTVSMTAEALDVAIRCGRICEAKREWRLLEDQLDMLIPQVQKLLLQMSSPRTAVQ